MGLIKDQGDGSSADRASLQWIKAAGNNMEPKRNQCDANNTLFLCQKSLTCALCTDLKSVVDRQVRT